jgi:hypothetical protein
MSGPVIGPVLVLALVIVSDAWMVWDASRRSARHDEVVAQVGPVVLDTPARWLIACLVLWIIAFPMYLVARRA